VALLVGNVLLPDEGEAEAAPHIAGLLKVPVRAIVAWKLVRRSLDARKHPPIRKAVFRVEVKDEAAVLRKGIPSVRPWTDKDDARYGVTDAAAPTRIAAPSDARVIVVGAGPAGLFAALYLAEAGVPVTLLDRGQPVEGRVAAVNGHWRRKLPLDPENNVLFGEGGAGTFSDGKIYTRRRDGEIGYVLRRFVDFGARTEVLEEGWAHLGTDKVREILPVFRARLAELGVDVRYGARVEGWRVAGGQIEGVILGDGSEVRGSHVVVAPGHSARDTVTALVEAGAAAVARPVAIGARVEHPQTVIDAARYGGAARGDLPAASYRLAHHPPAGQPGAFKARTFCMCPGGMVVPASNEPGRVVVNGMSFAAQRGFFANSAVIVELDVAAYGGGGPLAGYQWQDEIERRAFDLAGGDDSAPAQRVEDFLAGVVGQTVPKVSYPLGVRPVDLRGVLPGPVLAGMADALRAFGRQLRGFDGSDAVLIAPETRTTSPVGFVRDEHGQSTTVRGLYPCGEGAGFGGGIVSCAIDGIRVAKGVLASLGA
jgi:uncharacterized FAD-dependent dehydrogenase